MGKVYWITGLAGAGKTTVGLALYEKLKNREKCVLLDGDILKEIVGAEGYSKEERLFRARRYCHLVKLISEQGITVIICTISLFRDIHDWNRKYIPGYVEIFLDVPIDVLRKRNYNGLYADEKNAAGGNIAGLDLEVDFPESPAITITNDGRFTPTECADKILAVVQNPPVGMASDSFDRDTEYWDAYYREHPSAEDSQSKFAEFALSFIPPKAEILELGCGNGRDSLYFIRKNHSVIGVDASAAAIAIINRLQSNPMGLFVCGDFVGNQVLYQKQYDIIYSRFTWHSITTDQEDQLLPNVAKSLKKGGRLLIEARSIRDNLCGKGRALGDNAYIYNDHFRRFIDPAILQEKIVRLGLKVEFLKEGRGFAPTPKEDPVLLRIMAAKL